MLLITIILIISNLIYPQYWYHFLEYARIMRSLREFHFFIEINVESFHWEFLLRLNYIIKVISFVNCYRFTRAVKKYIRKKVKKKDEFIRIDLNRRDSPLSSTSATMRNNAKSGKWKPVHFLRSMPWHRADRTNRWIKWTARREGNSGRGYTITVCTKSQ